jgi:hypothetical protein
MAYVFIGQNTKEEEYAHGIFIKIDHSVGYIILYTYYIHYIEEILM